MLYLYSVLIRLIQKKKKVFTFKVCSRRYPLPRNGVAVIPYLILFNIIDFSRSVRPDSSLKSQMSPGSSESGRVQPYSPRQSS
nr:MAG TPA: hypothetical protein [Caudoviricetes sp.]